MAARRNVIYDHPLYKYLANVIYYVPIMQDVSKSTLVFLVQQANTNGKLTSLSLSSY